MTEYEKLGQLLLEGGKVPEIEIGGKKFALSPKQIDFVSNFQDRFCLYSGGYGCGKSLALYLKLILFCKCFPGNRVLLGRRTLADIERAILPDLFELMPRAWYDHRVKDALINFKNGSQVILFGLDALQEGSLADIKKAQQKIKSLNLGAYFIDQLEEVEKDVFLGLNSRLRRMDVPFRQGNMTCNPANFWAYPYFKAKPEKGTFLIEGSMLDNKKHLPDDYLQDQMDNDERYVRRYVHGEWTPDVLTDKAVFAQEHVNKLEKMVEPPIATEEGCKIWEQWDERLIYQMAIDPSEGVIDPSSISVISSEGKKVAKWNGKIPLPALIEKTKFLYYKYHHPLIIPEANASGQALLLGIRDLKIFRRKVYDYKFDKETELLGWKTNYQTKQSLINNFQNLLRSDFPQIHDKQTVEELKTFIWASEVRHKGAGAQRGFHDDDVISTLLGYWGFSPEVLAKRKKRQERERSKIKIRKRFQYF